MTTISNFKEIKEELNKTIKDILQIVLENRIYFSSEVEYLCDCINDNILENIKQKNIKHYKFGISTYIFKKGNCSLNFSSNCLWTPNNDGSLTVKFENENLYCFVVIFGASTNAKKEELISKKKNNDNDIKQKTKRYLSASKDDNRNKRIVNNILNNIKII